MYGKATIHDHFDGSARCRECRGPCKLTGADLWATALVRAIFEGQALSGKPAAYYVLRELERGGINVTAFTRRGKEAR